MTHEEYTLPSNAAPVNHGRTRSAWVLTATVVFGFTIAGVGMAIPNTGLLITGFVVLVVGSIASWILRAQGHGQPLAARSDDWYEG